MKIEDRDLLMDLFRRLQPKLGLKIEQYWLLLDAWQQGYGQSDWDKLRRICRLIWLKTSSQLDPISTDMFDRIFDRWQADCQQAVRDWFAELNPAPVTVVDRVQLGILPIAPPPRKGAVIPPPLAKTPNPIESSPTEVPVAVKGNQTSLKIERLPITLVDIKGVWRSLRSSIPDLRQEELDLDRTIEKFNRDGYLNDLVMKSIARPSINLLVFIDDHHKMRPYRPVYEPLIRAISSYRISPGQIYRFISYPTDYVDNWEQPIKSIHLGSLLSKLNPEKTIVLIISDAGAATQSYRQSRITGTRKFLEKLLPSVREVLWLNPVPEKYWVDTSAMAIDRALGGRMIPFESVQWQEIGKKSIAEVQLWLLNQSN